MWYAAWEHCAVTTEVSADQSTPGTQRDLTHRTTYSFSVFSRKSWEVLQAGNMDRQTWRNKVPEARVGVGLQVTGPGKDLSQYSHWAISKRYTTITGETQPVMSSTHSFVIKS